MFFFYSASLFFFIIVKSQNESNKLNFEIKQIINGQSKLPNMELRDSPHLDPITNNDPLSPYPTQIKGVSLNINFNTSALSQ